MKNRSSCNIVVLSYYLQATLALLVGLVMLQAALGSAAKPPAIFILGDSTVDVGTNSYLQESRARADFPHYGIDFPRSRPTGRFSNGLNGADFLGDPLLLLPSYDMFLRRFVHLLCYVRATFWPLFEFYDWPARLMGYNSSPRPFLSLGSPLLSYLRNHAFRGANFASAGSGLLDLTGSALVSQPLFTSILFMVHHRCRSRLFYIRRGILDDIHIIAHKFFLKIWKN